MRSRTIFALQILEHFQRFKCLSTILRVISHIHIKRALSAYHNIHQDQKYLTNLNNAQNELNQREQQFSNRIAVLHQILKETKVRDEKDMNAVYRKGIESIINEGLSKMNCPHG
ncbi:histone acetyltransferase [Trifolium repens]|jgi:uncharacterized protein YhaN|nr:hypothetical protein QL285_024978 [Trifolium repens]WJX55193.1 histone acetyltransferase [Trifolium repens]